MTDCRTRVLGRCLLLGLLTVALLAPTLPAAPPAKSGPAELPSVGPLIQDQASALDTEIASLIMQRPDAGQAPHLELQIDLRILTRWFLSQAAAAKAGSDAQVSAYLRAGQMTKLVYAVDELLQQQAGQTVARPPYEAMVKLHERTYKLGEIKDVKQTDDLLSEIGQLLVVALNVSDKNFPAMRPEPIDGAGEPGKAEGANRPRTVEQLAAEVRQASISVPLRKQLLALSTQATAAVGKQGQETESQALHQQLTLAVDLVKGLQTNTAVSQEARNQIEWQLAEGVALFVDPRTRASGQAKIDALNRYRQILTRVGRMEMSDDMARRLAPAFAWAQENIEGGPKVLAAVERFITVMARHTSRKPAAGTVPAKAATVLTDLQNRFNSRRDAFINDASDLGGDGIMGTSPDNLASHVNDLQNLADAIETLEQLAATQETLLAHKPKPFGGLEKRVTLAIANLTAADNTAQHEAQQLLMNLRRLAETSTQLSAWQPGSLPEPVADKYTGGQARLLEGKWRPMIGEMVSAVAGGGSVDQAKLDRLAMLVKLTGALDTATKLETAMEAVGSFENWVDWGMSREQLDGVMSPYRYALSSGFEGFMNDEYKPMERWQAVEKQYLPLIDLIVRDSQYAEACAELPGGMTGKLGKLMTPLSNQPFAIERFLSLALPLWTQAEMSGDRAGAEAVSEVVTKRLAGAPAPSNEPQK